MRELGQDMGTSPKKVIRLRSGSATMPIENVQSQTVSRLREAIIGGTFSPGERLVENALCQRFGVSRTSIREALRRLEAVSYTHLRAHETVLDLVCRLLLEKKKTVNYQFIYSIVVMSIYLIILS